MACVGIGPRGGTWSVDEAPVKRVPVTLVTGFLGSGPRLLRFQLRATTTTRRTDGMRAAAGKTTMLNHLLTKSALHRKGRKLAVLVNEFGQVAIALAALCCWM